MPNVVVPIYGQMSRRVRVEKVVCILSNRVKGTEEQYLVQWESDTSPERPPLSWHNINELSRCLELVQDYLDARTRAKNSTRPRATVTQKRKASELEHENDRPLVSYALTASRTPSRSPSVGSSYAVPASPIDCYNGVLDVDTHGFIVCQGSNIAPQIELRHIPTPDMVHTAHRSKVDKAATRIREEYLARLAEVPGKKIHLVNIHDHSTPSLRFRYIAQYILREGVIQASRDTQEGCQKCSPQMGRNIGCEYTQKCACLEYAAVNEAAIAPEMMAAYEKAKAEGTSLADFPKRFPYYAEGTKIRRAGTLVPFYLHSRRPIYECNDNCRCGPHCRNKNVQFGRTVEVEIFRTGSGRGWGLRCRQHLYEGQFIDTYRGEVITDAEATRREEQADKTKSSYLYSLDKFAESEGYDVEDLYVVDGEFYGGPTKFMNHSCEPNCRQYTVSYNKHDARVYDIAFFACRDIPAGEELTFDYLDKEEGEAIEDPGPDAIPCLCGAEKCRKWLWT